MSVSFRRRSAPASAVGSGETLGPAGGDASGAVTTTFVLVDYENVQPTELSSLRGRPYKVKLFLGATQAKIPVTLAAALQALGADAEYVVLESSGPNALDFHIAYYIGQLSAQEPTAQFHIISKDTGFDPLIKHLELRGVVAQRFPSIRSIASLRPFVAPDVRQLDLAITHLGKMKAAKPRTQKTLLSTLHALFKKELTETQLSALIAALCERGIVKVDGAKVSY